MATFKFTYELRNSAVLLFDSILTSAPDVALAAQGLLRAGAMKLCCGHLMYPVMTHHIMYPALPYYEREKTPALCKLSAEQIARVLRVLRRMFGTGDSSSAVMAQFTAGRGLQALDLLRYDDGLQESGGELIMSELTQLRALLADMTVIAVDTPETEKQRLQTLAELQAFIKPHRDWEVAFDAYISCTLTKAGLLREAEDGVTTENGLKRAPSPALLSLLQARARECSLLYTHTTREHQAPIGDDGVAPDVSMELSLDQDRQRPYSVVIRPDDKGFPANAAHFRLAHFTAALGSKLHTCIVPQGHEPNPPAPLPFITLLHPSSCYRCFTQPVSLPETDLVYGEYAPDSAHADAGADDADASSATYPVGTVLMYPIKALLSLTSYRQQTLPWFIVYKPCPKRMLRGAIPVGRVVSCLQSGGDASGTEIFDATTVEHIDLCFSSYHAEGCGRGTLSVDIV